MVRRGTVRIWAMLAGVFILTGCHAVATKPDLGPQSKQATGELSVLMVAVRFPDAKPGMALDRIKTRVTGDLDRYIREQSYGQAWVKADFRGWVDLPDSLEKYKVSPYNFQVDRTRVRKLVELASRECLAHGVTTYRVVGARLPWGASQRDRARLGEVLAPMTAVAGAAILAGAWMVRSGSATGPLEPEETL